MISILLAASLSFSASATGVEKGTPIEFLFAGKDSDRDYETMFLLDEPLSNLCARLEKAGLPRGRATSVKDCVLWPVGCRVSFGTALSDYIETKWPNGIVPSDFVYTGGTRTEKGTVVAQDDMPMSFCALYSLAQSPVVFNGIYNQGDVYGAHVAKVALKKGEKKTFTLTWDEKTMPRRLTATFTPGSATQRILEIKAASEKGEVDVLADFDPSLTVAEAEQIAQALAVVDSPRVKINGRLDGRLFYRAFLPQVKWRERRERLQQPFEFTVGAAASDDSLVFVEEDWKVEGNDPKLTPKKISFAEAKTKNQTTTCFLYAPKTMKLGRVYEAMKSLKGTKVVNWYVLSVE